MAIYQPNEMDFRGKHFSMIISGSPGIGKTTLALSAPNPVLIDFDRGVSRVMAQHRKVTICADTYEEILNDMENPVVKSAETMVIDTGGSFITYLQDWAMRDNPTLNKQKNGAISLKGFGAVKSEFVSFTNRLQYVMNKNIIYVFHTVEEKDGDVTKQRLMCEGAARNIVWQPCDLGCFIQMVGGDRFLGFSPTEQYFAKGCFGISGLIKIPTLDDETPNDFISRIFDRARENISKEAAIFGEDQKRYHAAIEKADKIIDRVQDSESAMAASNQMKEIPHCLTSEREAKAMFSAKLTTLGLKWDKGARAYVGAE